MATRVSGRHHAATGGIARGRPGRARDLERRTIHAHADRIERSTRNSGGPNLIPPASLPTAGPRNTAATARRAAAVIDTGPAFNAASFDRAKFFEAILNAPFTRRLTDLQKAGMTAVLDHWVTSGFTDLRWLAYMFATTFHETGTTMQPIEEWGKGRGKAYGRPDPITGQTYYGRGFVQLTWKENYQKMGALLGENLVDHPELALDTNIAARIMFEGMTTSLSLRGDFTGRSLEQFFTATTSDWEGARKIINGRDKAKTIANYGKQFFAALKTAQA